MIDIKKRIFIYILTFIVTISVLSGIVSAYPIIPDDVIEEEESVPLNLDYELYRGKYVASNGMKIGYVIYVPENATTNMPIIVWLHGIGQVGKTLPDDYGLIKAVNELDEDRFIILQPEAKQDWTAKKQFSATLDLIDVIVAKYKVDADRVILSGHSLGAIGAWYYAEKETERWAAVVPVSSRAMITLNNLKEYDVPVWAFCTNGDVRENVYGMKNNIDTLLLANPDRDVLYTKIKGVSHSNMSYAPYTKDFFDWVEKQKRKRY